jgi:hypothetical protein
MSIRAVLENTQANKDRTGEITSTECPQHPAKKKKKWLMTVTDHMV